MIVMDYFDILLTRLMIWRLRRSYGADCKIRDVDEPDWRDIITERGLNAPSRCASCQAAEVIDWLNEHIEWCR
jgi:hypothetical protein